MKKIIPHAPSLEVQMENYKKRWTRAVQPNMDMVYGEEALTLFKKTKCMSMRDFSFKGEVGSEQYKESVDNYWLMMAKHLRWNNILVGKEIYIEDSIDRLFVSKKNDGLCGVFAYYYDSYNDKIVLPISLGYFGISLPVYNPDDIYPTGEFVCPVTDSVHDVYDAVKDCDTFYDVWNVLKGKCLRAEHINRFITAKATVEISKKREVVSTGVVSLACFTFISRYLNKVTSPELCCREYRIVSNEYDKWGIYNDEKGVLLVGFFFDKIEWCRYDITKEAKYVLFYKNEKMAICRIEDIEQLK